MLRKYLLPLLALLLLAFAVLHVVRAQQDPPRPPPPVEPARTPFGKTVAGAGIVEAQTENIAIGSHLPGVVTEVAVQVGQKVQAGAVLFRLDDRHLQAELKVRQANLASAEAQRAKLESLPRPEELPPSEARVREAEANLVDQEDQLQRTRTLYATRAVGEEDLVRQQQAYRMAREQLARARAEYDLLRAGAGNPTKRLPAPAWPRPGHRSSRRGPSWIACWFEHRSTERSSRSTFGRANTWGRRPTRRWSCSATCSSSTSAWTSTSTISRVSDRARRREPCSAATRGRKSR
jgi:multidrug efflux pump subunit AcrA (membrane-fusion protein)